MGLMVILDAGHGADTPGKRSPDGRLREGRWARAMAARLAGALAGPGRECPLVVPGDADMPLPERAARVNELAARAERAGLRAVLMSLHCDAAGMGDSWRGAQGWSVYVAPGAQRPSARLAGLLVEAMRGEGVKVRARGAREPWWEAKFYMLAYTRCPAVLTENLYMDNREDCERLLSEAWNARLARGYARAFAALEADWDGRGGGA